MHKPLKKTFRTLSVLLLAMSLLATACGDDGQDASPDTPTTTTAASTDNSTVDNETVDPVSDLEGDLLISGSSTVFPIVQRQAEEFSAANPGVAIAVEGPGSGDGAVKFCNGEVPIANASRLYKDSEMETCAANGIEFIEIRRGIDGITVVTSSANGAIECLSFNQLYALISEDATGFESWADANALLAEIGSTAESLPDASLDIFGPGEESGTFDSFAEIVMEAVAKGKTGLDPESREFSTGIRPDYTSSPDDNIIIEGISDADYSLGWVGFAFGSAAADAGSVKMIPVAKEDGGECVLPTPETIASAEFPIARYLYTYVSVSAAASDPAVAAFVDYMMSDQGLEAVAGVGYVPLADADQQLAQAIWADRVTGRTWG